MWVHSETKLLHLALALSIFLRIPRTLFQLAFREAMTSSFSAWQATSRATCFCTLIGYLARIGAIFSARIPARFRNVTRASGSAPWRREKIDIVAKRLRRRRDCRSGHRKVHAATHTCKHEASDWRNSFLSPGAPSIGKASNGDRHLGHHLVAIERIVTGDVSMRINCGNQDLW